MNYQFDQFYTESGWQKSFVTTDENGMITNISSQPTQDTAYIPKGKMLPGFLNTHSHAFQYGMAAMAEKITGKPDTFWSWRTKMYELALSIDPDQLEAIATMLYSEMLRNGYIHVVEFHYLHHDKSGKPFDNLAEMGSRLVRAAKNTGIGITLVPMFYQKGGFNKEAESHQRRFLSANTNEYLKLLEATKKVCMEYASAQPGIGVHSMRAVGTEELKDTFEARGNLPFHTHISEQVAEIEDCLKHTGKRPVELLMSTIDADTSVHLVHSTHINTKELDQIIQSGASAVLCPSTEGNLGDGIFPFREFIEKQGNWSVGSDSHVTLNPWEELRWLDYGQRLTSLRRDTYSSGREDMGEEMYHQCLTGSAPAAGISHFPYFKTGMPLSGIILNDNHPMIGATAPEHLINSMVYSSDIGTHKEILIKGKTVVENQSHVNQSKFLDAFSSTMKKLGVRG